MNDPEPTPQPVAVASTALLAASFYACWQRPHWKNAFHKGPISHEDALSACREQEEKGVPLIWIEDENGNKTPFKISFG